MSSPRERVRIGLLGPLQVVVDGHPLVLGGHKQRIVLALLLLESPRVVSTDRLIDAVWGDAAGDRALATLQVYISNLRKALEPARAALGVRELIVTQSPGYRLDAGPARHDALAFADQVETARRALLVGDAPRAALAYRAALGLWRGDVLADLRDETAALDAARARLEGERHATRLDYFDASLAAGRHLDVLAELHAVAKDNPLDERVCGQLMLALYRSGRQAEALAAFQSTRLRLVEELGIDPGRELRALEAQVLAHDPALELPTSPHQRPGEVPDFSTVLRSVSRPSVWLVVDGQRVPLARAVTTVGRRADRHLVLDGDDVSRLHAELRRVGDDVLLVDVGSANGTWVNGRRVAEARLAPGDTVTIGTHRLEFVSSGQ